jgi:hypothetical protein
LKPETPRCGRKTHQEPYGPCRNPVPRPGDVCRFHGGAAPQVKAARERRRQHEEATEAVRTYGLPVDIAPEDALLEEVHRTAGHVAYLNAIVGEGKRSDLMQWVVGAGDEGGAAYQRRSVWVELYQEERKHLVGVCKAAITAGIAERQVRLAERQGELVGELLRVAIEAARLTPDQQQAAYSAVRGHLTRVA